jgi:hypothetical protein
MVGIWKSVINDGLIRTTLYLLNVLEGLLQHLNAKKMKQKNKKMTKKLKRRQSQYTDAKFEKKIEESDSSDESDSGSVVSDKTYASTKSSEDDEKGIVRKKRRFKKKRPTLVVVEEGLEIRQRPSWSNRVKGSFSSLLGRERETSKSSADAESV